jgi:choline dehydrogenase
MSRANLKIFINAHATRLLFDRHRACGVEFARDGRLEQVQADTEVILAGGAYNSPQLLMLSGIGPASELTRIGISVRGDLPVGVGLQDHPWPG